MRRAAALVLLAVLAAAVPQEALVGRTAVADAAYTITNPAIQTYFGRHGGTHTFGAPVSNQFRLLGSQVQVFQRQAIQVRPDGSVGPLDLVAGGVLPLAVVDPRVVATAPKRTDDLARADAYLAAMLPEVWQGEPVHFNTAYRSSLSCADLIGVEVCNERLRLAITLEVWGFPIAPPTPDPRNPDFTYLWFERGGLVHSRSAGRTEWLLLGQLFKNVLMGGDIGADLLTRIQASPASIRFYGQYDPTAGDGLVRPDELPNTSLVGAFQPAPAASRPALDARFGVAEAFRDPATMTDLGAGWERIVLPWDDIQPRSAGDFSRLGITFPPDRLAAEVARGVHVAAVLQATPGWAQLHPEQGKRSVPRNLDLPFDDSRNYWGNYVYQTVRHYAGQIDEWILWNEPDFRLEDPGGAAATTWLGSVDEFAQLLKVGYLAAKRANPRATISFPATSYWADETSRPKRPQFYDRVLGVVSRDPAAVANGFYHDAVALNLYRNPDDVYRVHALFKTIQRRYGLDKPLWLTELNTMPVDDRAVTCASLAGRPSGSTLDQQSAYVAQAVSLAAAAGYQHIEFFQMADGDPCQQQQLWGLIRGDGTRRPVADVLKLTIGLLAGYTQAQFAPLARGPARWSAWPDDPASYEPNWQLYQIVFDKPDNERVTVLWSGNGGAPLNVRVRQTRRTGWLIDATGKRQPLVGRGGWWTIQLPPAPSAQPDGQVDDPAAYHVIGGQPAFLVENGPTTS
jgi:hypothetical protein